MLLNDIYNLNRATRFQH